MNALFILSNALTYTHTYTHIHTHIHTQHTHTHTYIHTYTYTHTYTHNTHTYTHIHAHNTCSLFTFQCSKKYQRKFLRCSQFHHYCDSFTINKRSGENDLVFENVQSMQPLKFSLTIFSCKHETLLPQNFSFTV